MNSTSHNRRSAPFFLLLPLLGGLGTACETKPTAEPTPGNKTSSAKPSTSATATELPLATRFDGPPTRKLRMNDEGMGAPEGWTIYQGSPAIRVGGNSVAWAESDGLPTWPTKPSHVAMRAVPILCSQPKLGAGTKAKLGPKHRDGLVWIVDGTCNNDAAKIWLVASDENRGNSAIIWMHKSEVTPEREADVADIIRAWAK